MSRGARETTPGFTSFTEAQLASPTARAVLEAEREYVKAYTLRKQGDMLAARANWIAEQQAAERLTLKDSSTPELRPSRAVASSPPRGSLHTPDSIGRLSPELDDDAPYLTQTATSQQRQSASRFLGQTPSVSLLGMPAGPTSSPKRKHASGLVHTSSQHSVGSKDKRPAFLDDSEEEIETDGDRDQPRTGLTRTLAPSPASKKKKRKRPRSATPERVVYEHTTTDEEHYGRRPRRAAAPGEGACRVLSKDELAKQARQEDRLLMREEKLKEKRPRYA